jgi:hypothetical protein
MATTITAATLTVTITEEISLNGQDKGSTNTLTITSVTEVSQRIVEVPTSEITILSFQATNPGAGTFDRADVRYIRLTNKDDTNHVVLVFTDDGSTEFILKLDAGKSFIWGCDNSGGVVNNMLASGSAITVNSTAMAGDLVTISAIADTAACDLEIFVAGD